MLSVLKRATFAASLVVCTYANAAFTTVDFSGQFNAWRLAVHALR